MILWNCEKRKYSTYGEKMKKESQTLNFRIQNKEIDINIRLLQTFSEITRISVLLFQNIIHLERQRLRPSSLYSVHIMKLERNTSFLCYNQTVPFTIIHDNLDILRSHLKAF